MKTPPDKLIWGLVASRTSSPSGLSGDAKTKKMSQGAGEVKKTWLPIRSARLRRLIYPRMWADVARNFNSLAWRRKGDNLYPQNAPVSATKEPERQKSQPELVLARRWRRVLVRFVPIRDKKFLSPALLHWEKSCGFCLRFQTVRERGKDHRDGGSKTTLLIKPCITGYGWNQVFGQEKFPCCLMFGIWSFNCHRLDVLKGNFLLRNLNRIQYHHYSWWNYSFPRWGNGTTNNGPAIWHF